MILEIESYELYHIGNKLNPATSFDSLKIKLKDKLKTAGYSTTEKILTGEQMVLDYPTELLGIKNDVRVELNHLAQALNVIGTKPNSVTEIFSNIISILPDIGYELDKISLFYEILASVVIKSEHKKPADILNKSIKLDLTHLSIKGIPNTDITAIRIGGENTTEAGLYTLSIQPNPTSPGSRFLIKVQYRLKDQATVESFYVDLASNIIELTNQLEKI